MLWGGGLSGFILGVVDIRSWGSILNFFQGPEGPYRGVGLKVLGLRVEFFSNWICIYYPNILYLSGRKNSWMHYVVVVGSRGVILGVGDFRSWDSIFNCFQMGYASMTPIYYTYLGGKKSWMHYVVVGGPVGSYWGLRIVGPGLGF